jgi:hypothetical protein
MLVNPRVKKVGALVLAGVAIAVAGEVGLQVLAAGPASAAAANRGNPNAVPPILRPASRSELAEMRAEESWEGREYWYDPPASARYDSAVLGVFAARGNGRS